MAQTKLIKKRIKAAKNISQITRAMQMVAAARMKKAQDLTLTNRAYANKLFEMTRNLIQEKHENSQILKHLYLIISPNKGLCGSLNTNLYKNILEIITRETEDVSFVTIGKISEQAVTKYSKNLIASFDFGINQPTYELIVPVAKFILNEYKKGVYKEVCVLYTDFENTLVQRPRVIQILPIKKDLEGHEAVIEYIFEPDRRSLLTYLIPYYIENQLFQLVLESYASEQSARMMAMKNATDNANEITKELTLIYNRARQTQITNEIADIATAQMVI